MVHLRTIALFLGLFMFTGSLWGADTPKHGGRLVFGIRKDLSSLNPFWRTQSTDSYVRQLIFEGLLDFDLKGKPVPALAESWKISSDGKTYTFKLRSGVKFHNGKEMTAQDVKWSADYALDPKNAATGLSLLRNVKSVKAKGKLTIEFTLKEREPIFLTTLASIRPFTVVPEGSVPTGERKIKGFPPGTGPFMFKDYQRARQVIVVRNKNYWQKGLPYLDEVVMKPVRDTQARFTSLRAGDLDLIERAPYAFVRKLLNGGYPKLGVIEAKHSGFRRLIFEVTKPPFNNRKVRQAVRYALDMNELITAAYWGFGEPATVWAIPNSSPWFNGMPEVKRDVAKAKTLLKESGAGSDLVIKIHARRGEEDVVQVLQRQLVSAGFNVELEFLTGGKMSRMRRSGKFKVAFSGAEPVKDPADAYPFRFSCLEGKRKKRILNYSGYCNPKFDELVAEAGRITDQKKRFELYDKAIRILHSDLPEIPLIFVPRYFAFNKKVRGFTTDDGARFNLTTGGLSRTWLAK